MRIALVCATDWEFPSGIAGVENKISRGKIGNIDLATIVSGIGAYNAGTAAAKLIRDCKPNYLLSLGICGGANPDFGPGHLVLADAAWYNGDCFPLNVQPQWKQVLANAGPPYRIGAFEMSDYAVLSLEEVMGGACAVDAESYALAANAAMSGTPLLLVKAVSDILPAKKGPNGAARLAAEIELNFPCAMQSINSFWKSFVRTYAE